MVVRHGTFPENPLLTLVGQIGRVNPNVPLPVPLFHELGIVADRSLRSVHRLPLAHIRRFPLLGHQLHTLLSEPLKSLLDLPGLPVQPPQGLIQGVDPRPIERGPIRVPASLPANLQVWTLRPHTSWKRSPGFASPIALS